MVDEFHPWRDAGHLDVRWANLEQRLGAYDPDSRVIWLSHGLTQAERRSTLTHELIHAERGDEPCCTSWHDDKQERLVDGMAARRLIPLEQLVLALRWSQDERELAEELWVDVATVRARLEGLMPAETDWIESHLWADERGA